MTGRRWPAAVLAAALLAAVLSASGPVSAQADERPAAVTGVFAHPGDSPGELAVSWDAHPGRPRDAYRVAVAPVGGGYVGGEFGGRLGGPTRNTFARGTSATIGGLTPGGEYKVVVRARFRGAKNSEWSQQATGFAAAAVLADPDKGLRADPEYLLRHHPPSEQIVYDHTHYIYRRDQTVHTTGMELRAGTGYTVEVTMTLADGTPLRPGMDIYEPTVQLEVPMGIDQQWRRSNTDGYGNGLRAYLTPEVTHNYLFSATLGISEPDWGFPGAKGIWIRVWETDTTDDCGNTSLTGSACDFKGSTSVTGEFESPGDVDWWGPINLDRARIELKPGGGLPIEVGITGVYNTSGQLLNADGSIAARPTAPHTHLAASSVNDGVDGAVSYIFQKSTTRIAAFLIGVRSLGTGGDDVGDYQLRIVHLRDENRLANDDLLPGYNVAGELVPGISSDPPWNTFWNTRDSSLGTWYEGVIEDDGDCNWRTSQETREADTDYFRYILERSTTYRFEMNGITLRDPQLRYIKNEASESIVHYFPQDTDFSSGTFDSRHEFTTPFGDLDEAYFVAASAQGCAAVNNGNSGRYRIRVTEVP